MQSVLGWVNPHLGFGLHLRISVESNKEFLQPALVSRARPAVRTSGCFSSNISLLGHSDSTLRILAHSETATRDF